MRKTRCSSLFQVLLMLSLGILVPVTAIWGAVEGILVLTGTIDRDAAGMPLKD